MAAKKLDLEKEIFRTARVMCEYSTRTGDRKPLGKIVDILQETLLIISDSGAMIEPPVVKKRAPTATKKPAKSSHTQRSGNGTMAMRSIPKP